MTPGLCSLTTSFAIGVCSDWRLRLRLFGGSARRNPAEALNCFVAQRKVVLKFIIEITISTNLFGQPLGRQWYYFGTAYSGKTCVMSSEI